MKTRRWPRFRAATGTLTMTATVVALAVALPVASGSSPANAAGFYIQEQGVTGLGRAYAGDVAMADDASTIFFNPAGLTRLESAKVQANAHLLIPRSTLSDRGSTVGPFPTGGGSGGNPYSPSPVPNAYFAVPVTDRAWVGFGLTAPFGLSNDYDDDFFGRYDSTTTSLTTINLSPTVGYEVTDRISIGAGVDIQYADVRLESKIPIPAIGPGGVPFIDPANDANFAVKGDDWSFGFNVGALFEPVDGTRVGVHYRSAISHDLSGTAIYSDFPQGSGLNGTTGGGAELNLPDIVSVGIAHEATDRLTLLGQVNWYGWSNFDEIRVEVDGRDDIVRPQNYRDSFAISLGADYDWTDDLTVRGGVQFDRTPTRDEFRTTRTPDGDRYWFSAGASYDVMENLTIDAAYTFIHVDSGPINASADFSGLATAETRGSTRGNVNIVALGLRYRF